MADRSFSFVDGKRNSRNSAMWAYTVHGWGYGLLLLDRVEDFLIMFYALASHAHTRGTWTAAEISELDRNATSSGYCVPTQTLVPTYLKWLLVWEDPVSRTLWLGKAAPRNWLAVGETIAVANATTRYGRLSFSTHRASKTELLATLAMGPAAGFPPGGVKLRLRLPRDTRLRKASAGVLNATEETIFFASRPESELRVELEPVAQN